METTSADLRTNPSPMVCSLSYLAFASITSWRDCQLSLDGWSSSSRVGSRVDLPLLYRSSTLVLAYRILSLLGLSLFRYHSILSLRCAVRCAPLPFAIPYPIHYYSHSVGLAGGASGLVFFCLIKLLPNSVCAANFNNNFVLCAPFIYIIHIWF